MSNVINQYGDTFNPIGNGHGVDISSQRQDALDLSCLEFIRQQISANLLNLAPLKPSRGKSVPKGQINPPSPR